MPGKTKGRLARGGPSCSCAEAIHTHLLGSGADPEAVAEIMKGNPARFALVLLLLATWAVARPKKEDKVDPRLKQIHTIFLQGAFTAMKVVQDNRAEIEKGSCLKLAENADTADAVVKLSYTPGGTEKISTAGIMNPDAAITQVQPYHTALELSVREGAKMKRIWDKHVDLERGPEASRPGVLRLMDLLRHDACDGR